MQTTETNAPARRRLPVSRLARDAFGLEGRLGRLAQVRTFLVLTIVFAAGLLAVIPLLRSASVEAQLVGRAAGVALFIMLLWTNLAITVKRLHDFNRSGLHVIWVYAATAVALAAGSALHGQGGAVAALAGILLVGAGVIQLWLLLAPGTRGPNRFGG
jgi:uncharacterized membrane protein YhaH (DUF805 family)